MGQNDWFWQRDILERQSVMNDAYMAGVLSTEPCGTMLLKGVSEA